jgi:hypothetical protein
MATAWTLADRFSNSARIARGAAIFDGRPAPPAMRFAQSGVFPRIQALTTRRCRHDGKSADFPALFHSESAENPHYCVTRR